MRNPISCRTDSGLRCHFPDSYSTVQENFSHVRPSRLSIVPTFHIFQKDHPHRQSNPHEDASSRLVGANRKPNVFIPETSRSSKYLFKKVVDCFGKKLSVCCVNGLAGFLGAVMQFLGDVIPMLHGILQEEVVAQIKDQKHKKNKINHQRHGQRGRYQYHKSERSQE